jgi:hypothetical protein
VLRLREEARTEPGALSPEARAERDQVLALTGEAQRVFLAVLALARHRLARVAVTPPVQGGEAPGDFDRRVARLLEACASALDVPPTSAPGQPADDLNEQLAELERSLTRPTGSAARSDGAAVAFAQSERQFRGELVEELRRLTFAVRGDLQRAA